MIWSRAPHFPWKFKSWAGKLLKIWGSNPRSGRWNFFLFFSLFISKFFTQNWVSLNLTTFWYLVWLIRNQIKHGDNLCFYLYLICNTRYSKMVKKTDMQFFMENLKMKRKNDKKFWPSGAGIWTPDFPAHDLNFHVKWGARDQIKTSF